MPLARVLVFSLPRMAAPVFAAALLAATSFAGRPQLNEAPPAPEPAAKSQLALVAEAVPSGFVVDPASREASRIFFRTVYAASENVPSGWNGNVATGNAGTTSATFKEAVQRRVNYFRAMAGVSAGITFDTTYNTKDQKAALMMSANNSLSHAPPTTWTYYTGDGADAAGHSNIFLGSFGPAAVTGYIEDFGSPNASAGHRRWILYPQTRKMGSGDIPPTDAYESANALWVATPDYGTTRPAVRDEFVAWPPPGFVPYSLVFPRWSFTYPGADFSNATVTMQRGGANVAVAIENRGPGAGEASLVWTWDHLNSNAEMPPGPPPAADTAVQVAVNGVVINGQSRNFSYTVTLFDPQQAGADTVLAVASGPAQPIVGASAAYTCNAVPNASGYQFRTAPLSALTAIESAEGGTTNVTVDAPTGAALVSAAYHATGTKSFHFTTPQFDHQAITLKRTVLA
ncbi:MAG: CAP domain-containing protein, partial [Chthoniobacteraceae bacterium]